MIPGLGRCPKEGKGYPLQYSGLENTVGCIVHVVARGREESDTAEPLSLLLLRACYIFSDSSYYKWRVGTSLAVQWLRLCASNEPV